MTIESNDRRYLYNGNGVSTGFKGPRAFAATDVKVYLITDGVPTLVSTNDYTVTGVGRRNTRIEFNAAPAAGQQVLILRDVAYDQPTDLTNQGPFLPEIHEHAFDRQVMQIQQIADEVGRAFKLPETSTANVSFDVPEPEPLALLSWNETGDRLTNTPATQFVAAATAGVPFTVNVSAGQTSIPLPGLKTPWSPQAVFYNGIFQEPSAYTYDGSGITFNEALPADGRVVTVAVFGSPTQITESESLTFKMQAADSVTRAVRDKLAERVSVKDFGAVGDGVTVDNQSIINAIAQRPSGSAIRFPAGDWLIDERIDITLTSPLTIELDAGARLLGTSTSSGPMLTIRGGAGRFPLVVRGGQIDNGDRPFVLAEQSGTALDLIDIDDFLIEGVVFGRKSRDYVDNFGDSGITATRCQRGTVVGCTFYGQPDIGIYITGGASTGASDDYGDLLVTGNRFVRCSIGISAKRQFPRLVVVGNTFDECENGVTMFEAGGVSPGRCFVIANNVFRRSGTRAIRIHGPGVGSISGNVIEDFGFDRSLASVPAIGILLNGASDCAVTGNVIKFTDWTSDSNHTAISLQQTTIDGITYTPARNNITGNSIHAVYRALQESSAGINYYTANSIIGASTPVTGMNAASIIEFYDLNGRRVFVGSTEQARQSGTAHFVRSLRFFESATAAASAPAFSATHYIPINANGTTYYLPVSNAVW